MCIYLYTYKMKIDAQERTGSDEVDTQGTQDGQNKTQDTVCN